MDVMEKTKLHLLDEAGRNRGRKKATKQAGLAHLDLGVEIRT